MNERLSPESFVLDETRVSNALAIHNKMKGLGSTDAGTAKDAASTINSFMSSIKETQYDFLVEKSTDNADQATPTVASQIEDRMDLSKSEIPWAKECDSSIKALARFKLAMVQDPKAFKTLSASTNQKFAAIQNVLTFDPVISPILTEYAIIDAIDTQQLALDTDNIADLQLTSSSESLPANGNMKTFWGSTVPAVVEADDEPWSTYAEGSPLPGILLDKASMFNFSLNYAPVGYAIRATMEALRTPGMLQVWNKNQLQAQIFANRRKYRDIVTLGVSGFSADTNNFNFGSGVPTNITGAAPVTTQASIAAGITNYVKTNDVFAANPVTAGVFNPMAFCIWLRDKYLQMSSTRIDFFTKFPSIMVCNDDVMLQFLQLNLPVTNKTVTPADFIKAFGVDIQIPDLLGRIKLQMSLTTLNMNKTVLLMSPGIIEEISIQGFNFSSTAFDPEKRIYSENHTKASYFKPDTQQTRWVYSYLA